MSIEQLETAVKALPKDEYKRFLEWLADFDYDQWSLQIEKDSMDKDSPIMKMAQKALENHQLRKELEIGLSQADKGDVSGFDLEAELPKWRAKLAKK